ncbi:hypothetical protein Xen7305DRAFT_00042870 [Xenococcus sp. PCC 7305]|uniref:hypothetical protein n=1 Tax=Xenococcus sp. PCC 7305 TaxID=102125 RepID=UPI0002ABFE85|nr:hypothetical protein [Xenococcus sp. PCC 7305]ELS04553.1 hypothetical protein Xen7305DRAFT_00042870 [Xenococcus sp. PCC 7305]
MFFKISSKPQKVSYLVIILSFLGIIYSLQKEHYDKTRLQIEANNYQEQIESAQTTLNAQKRIPTFGFDNLRADITYLQFLQYFGDEEARKQTGYSLVPSYFETVSDYDPNFTQANLTFSVANSLYAGHPEKTITLMEKVLESSSPDLDDAYLIWFTKGLDELLFLGDTQAALDSYQNSTQSAIKQRNKTRNKLYSDKITKITVVSQRRIKYLATDPDTTEAQITSWKSVLPNVVDPLNRQRIRDRIVSLEQNANYQAKNQ